MNIERIQELELLEQTYWWHRGRRKILDRFFRKYIGHMHGLRILDVGCGVGGSYVTLEKFGSVTGVDISSQAVKICHKKGIENVVVGSAEALPFPNDSFDVIVSLDVLEHLGDDGEGIREFYRVLKPGGMVFITVPAHQFLWSEHDEALGHYRRYTRPQIQGIFIENGFTIEKVSYMITFTFPLIYGYRLLSRLSRKADTQKTSYVLLPKVLNDFLTFSLWIEAQLLPFVSMPFGVSILCWARKN